MAMYTPILCQTCKSETNLKSCRCGQAVYYCSKTCQLQDWARHKKSCPMVVVKEVEGKGKGVVSIRKIPAGTVIFMEDPLLIYKKEDQDEGFASFYQVPGYEQFKKMDSKTKHELMELHDPKMMNTRFDIHDDPEYAKFCRIVTANDVSINNKADPGDVDLGLDAVYKQFSRINHSCYPNSFAECDPGSVNHSVRAGRSIKKGEEVTISYLGSKEGTKEDRKEDLLNTWFFDCNCEVCSLTGQESQENDRVRMVVIDALIDVGSKEDLLRMMTDQKNIFRTLCKYLKVLAESYGMEQDMGKQAILLSCCHLFYQQVERIGGGFDWPDNELSCMVRSILQKKLGDDFLQKLDTLAISAASVMTRYFKAKVQRNLGLLTEVFVKRN